MASKLKSFYKGKKILLTGGTGFMGLSMVEKLLRTFPEVGTIYMLARDKKGVTLDDRKKEYFNNKVFDRLKKEHDGVDYNKLKWVYGDIRKGNLGLTKCNIEMIQDEVDLIIHGAAMLTFSLPLKAYVDTGVRAVDDLLKIAEGCKKLKGFMYISTAYAQTRITPNQLTTESVLEHPIPVRELLDMANRLTADEMERKSRELVQEWFNYYMYCKNATENLITEYERKFPIAIFRPSIVVHSYEEPIPYFIGNETGFGRVIMEAARGKVLYADPKANANTVPVDLAVNGALAALQNTAQDNKITVYNYSTNSNPCTFSDAFRYYSMSIPDYQEVLVPYRYNLMNLKDVPEGSLEAKQRQSVEFYYKFFERVGFATLMDWKWDNSNIDALWDQQNDVDKALLPFNVRACDWKKYFSNMYANQWGLPGFPEFENLTKERRAELRKQLFYLHCMNYDHLRV